MEFAKTYWFLNDKINQPKIDYYQHSNKTPYERGIEALDYFRYYGGKPLNIEKTYYNRLLMPIFDDLDLFQLQITNIFVEMKEFQSNFNQDETVKELRNLNKTIPIMAKEKMNHQKNHIKSIIEELKITKKGIKNDIKQIFLTRTILLPFIQFMQIRELKAQERNKDISLKFRINANKVRNLRENLLVQENLIEKMEAKREVERYNDYLISFKKDLESRTRIMKIERLKMKINDVQMSLEKEMLKKHEKIPKVKRKVTFYKCYKYDENNYNNNIPNDKNEIKTNKKSKGTNSKKSKISKITKKSKSKSSNNKKDLNENKEKEKTNRELSDNNEDNSENEN